MKAKMNWNHKVLALCLAITLLFASSLDVYAASATMTSYGSNGYYSVTYTAAHTYYSATASITVNEVGGGFLAYIVNTAVTAKAFNSYGDLYGTASSTGNYSCSATAYPGPGVALCINYSSASNLITSFNYTLSEE